MTAFGNYSKDNHKHLLEKDPDHYWIFRYPTSDDEIYMEKVLRNNPTHTEIMTAELAVTFGGSNITIEETGETFIDVDDMIFERLEKIRQLPRSLVVELSYALNEFNSEWGAVEE